MRKDCETEGCNNHTNKNRAYCTPCEKARRRRNNCITCNKQIRLGDVKEDQDVCFSCNRSIDLARKAKIQYENEFRILELYETLKK